MKIKCIMYNLFKKIPIKQKKILAFSYYGGSYSGSPKYIMEYLSESNEKFNIVWASVYPKKYKMLNFKVVKYNSILYFYHLATCKFIITNYRMTKEFVKRNGQIYIQTWHSSLRLKQIEKDAEETLSKTYLEMAKHDSTQIDRLIVGSKKSKDIFKQAFWYDGKYLEIGTPQCDIFFNKDREDIKQKVFDELNLDKNKKILLYAPTFRNDENLDVYHLDFLNIKKTFENKFGGDWVILLKLHPHLMHKKMVNMPEFVKNVSEYDDTQELMYIASALITDYSAIMFDFLYTTKPCFLHMIDFDDYITKERKLYFDINDLPFLVSKTNRDLLNNIEEFDEKTYKNKIDCFKENFIGSYENGTACNSVLEFVKQEMMKNEKI